jgi:hypothetical protein
MAIQQNFPDLKPSLLLDFARTKKLDPRVTFTRASSGTYFDSTGVLRTATDNEARFTHNPVTGDSLGIMREPQRANLLTYSEQFDDASWLKTNGTITANATVAPDGSISADLFTGTGTGPNYAFRGITLTQGVAYTLSCYVKQNNLADSRVLLRDFTEAGNATFNIVAGTVISNSGIASNPQITPVGNGWFRISAVFTPTIATGNHNISPVHNAAGNVTTGYFVWGAQIEPGAFPTSYTKTVGSSVTRAADSITNNYLGRTGQGTYFVDSTTQSGDTLINSGGTTFASTAATQQRTAVAYDATDTRRSIDGGAVTSSAGTTGATSLTIADGASGQISKVALYPVKLTDAQLQALTS